MEHGFYHPDRGYWQTTDDVPEEILSGYPSGTIEVPVRPSANHEWRNGEWTYIQPYPSPIELEPVRIACALRVSVSDDEVVSIAGSYRVGAMMAFDPGKFLAIFNQDLGGDEPFLVPNNGVCIDITEWGGDYAMLEIRDRVGGNLITPPSFGFSLYNF